MPTLEMPVWMDNGGAYAAGMDRSVLWMAAPVPGIMAPDTVTTAVGQEGVVAQHAGTANLSVDVSPFRAIVAEAGTTNANWRNWLCKHSGTAGTVTNVPLTAAPVANSRYDAVCVQVADSTVTGVANNWSFLVVAGTVAASPAFPAVPNNALCLAMVLRSTSQTQILTNQIVNVANRLWYEGGTRIAYAKYNPGTLTSPSTTSATFVPIVAGGAGTTGSWNVTFTAPPTGKVKAIIDMYAGAAGASGTSGTADVQAMYWSMIDSTNASPAGGQYAMTHWNESNINGTANSAGMWFKRHRYEAHITGLTPGNVYQWWPGWRRGNSTATAGVTCQSQVSNSNGDAWCAIYADA